MKHLNRALVFALLLATVLFNPADLPSCGPFFAEAVFTNTRTPPLPDYFHGKLGVVQPTFARKYLFVAYRYLSGQSLAKEEVASLIPSSNASEGKESIWIGSPNSDVYKSWMDARRRIPGLDSLQEIDIYRVSTSRPQNEYQHFQNCTEDAFKTAAATLENRIKLLGVGHPGITSWGIAQDMVFSNCSKGESIPAAPDPGLPQILRYDRAYQVAAAHFYSERYDAAAEEFRAIAADKSSPWSDIAPYLVARCLIRKATVSEKYGEFDRNALMEAERELRVIRQDKTRASFHSLAAKLEAFVAIRLHPLERIQTLAKTLERQTHTGDFNQDLTDYLYLMDHANTLTGLSLDDACRSSDMTDWIWTVPSSEDAAHFLDKWRATGSAAWLVAAMIYLHAGEPDAAAVMEAAKNLPKNSPAFATAQYHRIRLLMESPKRNEARAALDQLLPGLRASLPNSSLNLFLAQRMHLARNFDEFLEFAPRIPQGMLETDDSPTPLFDADSIQVFNRALPLSFLSQAVRSKLPSNLREQLLRAAWVRAALLSDNTNAAGLAGEMERVFPVLQADLKSWLAAPDPESKQFALVMLLMHFPGMSPYLQSGIPRREKLDGIDHLRENWWCGFNAGENLDEPTGTRFALSGSPDKKTPVPAEFPAFLGESDRAKFMDEWKKLAALPTAPDHFGAIVLRWAAKHPKDERVPEALHLVVKSTRFGCTDSENGRYSQSAFRLLHSRYPDTPWAKATPYWFR